jgi:hypothetical protein
MANLLSGLADEVELGVGADAFGRRWVAAAALCGGAGEDDEHDAGQLGGRGCLVPGRGGEDAGVRWPTACGMPAMAAVAAAMGTVSESPPMPAKRSPIHWVSRM